MSGTRTIAEPTPIDRAAAARRASTRPALVIDLDIVERNAARLADGDGGAGDRAPAARQDAQERRARPDPARRMARAGSRSATSARPRSSPPAGFDDLFIAYPIWAVGEKAARLRALHARRSACDLSVGFDSVEGARAARGRRRRAGAPAAASCWSSTRAIAAPAPGPRSGRDRRRRPSEPASRCAACSPTAATATGAARPTSHRRRGRGPGADDRARCAPRRRDRAGRHQRRLHADPVLGRPVAGQRDAPRHLPPRRPPAVGARRAAVGRPRRGHRGDGRERRGRRPGRDRRRRQGADQGRRAVPRGPRRDPGVPGRRHRARRATTTASCGSRRARPARARRGRRHRPEPRLPGRRPARQLRGARGGEVVAPGPSTRAAGAASPRPTESRD